MAAAGRPLVRRGTEPPGPERPPGPGRRPRPARDRGGAQDDEGRRRRGPRGRGWREPPPRGPPGARRPPPAGGSRRAGPGAPSRSAWHSSHEARWRSSSSRRSSGSSPVTRSSIRSDQRSWLTRGPPGWKDTAGAPAAGEHGEQRAPGPGQPRPDRPHRAPERLRRLAVGQALDVHEEDDRAEARSAGTPGPPRGPRRSPPPAPHPGPPSTRPSAARSKCGSSSSRAITRWRRLLPPVVGEDREEDREQPRLRVGAGGEVVEGPVGAEVALLDQVARVLGVAGEAHREPVQRAHPGEGLGLEAGPPAGLGSRRASGGPSLHVL